VASPPASGKYTIWVGTSSALAHGESRRLPSGPAPSASLAGLRDDRARGGARARVGGGPDAPRAAVGERAARGPVRERRRRRVAATAARSRGSVASSARPIDHDWRSRLRNAVVRPACPLLRGRASPHHRERYQPRPGINDVTLLCDGAGNCAGPTLACGGTPCSIGQDTCCSALSNSSEQLKCVTPASQSNSLCCGNGNGNCPSNQRAGENCMGTHDCPLGQVCCFTGGFGYQWISCQTACTQAASQVCDPTATPSECPSGMNCVSSGSFLGYFFCN